MRLELNFDEVATILAALTYYEDNDQGEPQARCDEVHADAVGDTIGWEVLSSLDNKGVVALHENIVKQAKAAIEDSKSGREVVAVEVKSAWQPIKHKEVECPECKEWRFIEKQTTMAGGTNYHCRVCGRHWSTPCL